MTKTRSYKIKPETMVSKKLSSQTSGPESKFKPGRKTIVKKDMKNWLTMSGLRDVLPSLSTVKKVSHDQVYSSPSIFDKDVKDDEEQAVPSAASPAAMRSSKIGAAPATAKEDPTSAKRSSKRDGKTAADTKATTVPEEVQGTSLNPTVAEEDPTSAKRSSKHCGKAQENPEFRLSVCPFDFRIFWFPHPAGP